MTRIHGDFHLGQVLVVERRRLHHRLRGRARPAARRAPRQDEPAARRRGPDALARLCRRHDARSQDTDLRAAGRGHARQVRQAPARRRAGGLPRRLSRRRRATCPASTTWTCWTSSCSRRRPTSWSTRRRTGRPGSSIPLHGLQRLMGRILGDETRSVSMMARAVILAGAVRARKPMRSRTAGTATPSRCSARATPRRAASIRAFLPGAQAVEVLRRSDRAVDRHARGAAAGRLVRGHRGRSRAVSAAHHLAGRGAGDRGSLFLRPAARRSRPASVHRGPPFRAGQGARRPRHDPRRRRGRGLRGLGAERQRASPWSATSTPGIRGAIRCGCAFPSGVWELFVPRVDAGRALQVRHRRRGRRAAAAEGRSAREADRAAAGHRLRRRLARAVSTGTTGVDGRARAARHAHDAPIIDLRGPSRLVDAAPARPGTTRPTG